jgi:hypothetical protein
VLVALGGYVAGSGMHTVSHMMDADLGGRSWDAYALGALTALAAAAMLVRHRTYAAQGCGRHRPGRGGP